MRYTISTNDEQGLIGIQLSKWEKEGKLSVIERADTLVEIEAKLEKVAAALNVLKRAGYDSEVMRIYMMKKTGLGLAMINLVLHHQEQFLKQVGALK